MDIAPADDARETAPRTDADGVICSVKTALPAAPEVFSGHGHLPARLRAELWEHSEAEAVGVTEAEFGAALEAVGQKNDFGLERGSPASDREREQFWRGLHLKDLALARGCAKGCETAWQQFMTLYEGPVRKAATGMARSAELGDELVSGLFAELYGVTDSGPARRPALERYSGRGSLMGWLRAILAQRLVDAYRKTRHETALEDTEPAAPEAASPGTETLAHLTTGVQSTLKALGAEERFLLTAYFLDGHTLAEVSRVLGVHEATVSRKLKRAAERVRKDLLKALVTGGLSRRAAEEALGTDPRDVDINLRRLLQRPEDKAYSDREGRG